MSSLLSSTSRAGEIEQIKDGVSASHAILVRRLRGCKKITAWLFALWVLSACAGGALLYKGAMPSEIELPRIGHDDFIFYSPLASSYVTKTQLKLMIKNEDWSEAQKLMKFTTDPAPDTMIFKAQIAFLSGHENESMELIKDQKLDLVHPDKVWRIESLYAEAKGQGDSAFSQGIKQYLRQQSQYQNWGWLLLGLGVALGSLWASARQLVTVMQRNLETIQTWIKSIRKSKEDMEPSATEYLSGVDMLWGQTPEERINRMVAARKRYEEYAAFNTEQEGHIPYILDHGLPAKRVAASPMEKKIQAKQVKYSHLNASTE